MHWNGGFVEAWNPHMRQMVSDAQDVQDKYGQNKTRYSPHAFCISYRFIAPITLLMLGDVHVCH